MPRLTFRPVSLRPRHTLAPLALAGLLLGGGAHAQATLSMTPAASTTAVGSVVTFTVNLSGSANTFGYDVNVFIDPTQLKFVGTAPYTNLDADYPNLVLPPATMSTPFPELPSPGNLRFAFTSNGQGINDLAPTPLGSFQVTVLSALPLTGSAITFGAPAALGSSGDASTGRSEVADATMGTNMLVAVTNARLLTPAPEPSQTAALGIGLLGLGALALTARRRLAANRE